MSTRNPFFASIYCVLILSLAFGTMPISAHDDKSGGPKSVEEHRAADFGFKGFDKLNAELYRDFLSFDNAVNFSPEMMAEQNRLVADSHLNGTWSPSFTLPLVPIHVMLMTNGKILMWDSVGDNPTESYPVHNFTRASIWDPSNNFVTNVNNTTTGFNMFCSGHAHLPNGTSFLAGGNLNSSLDGISATHLFNQDTNTWSLGPTMTQGGRWYPSVTPLANGEMLITSGGPSKAEVYTTSGTLRTLSNATLSMPLYPWLQAAPKGQAFYFGPSNSMRYINTAGTGTLGSSLTRDGINRTYGSFAMYDIGKLIASGGGTSSKKTVLIDISNPDINPVVTVPADMAFGRRQHNLTVLPDGSVLATGGNDSGASLIDMNNNVFEAELWNPTTKTWRTLSSASKVRQYHSTAILLPDGRVFTGGGGICGTCQQVSYLEKNMEIFTPPYLYASDGSGNLAPRPDISSAPASVVFDQSFFAGTTDPSSIRQAVMMRVSSVTHSIDFEQRRIPLKMTVAAGGLNLKAPANANIAPPGYYMLFLVDASGVPSVAKMIRVDAGTALGAPMIVNANASGGSVTVSWIPVPGATGYRIKFGSTAGSHPVFQDFNTSVNTRTLTGISGNVNFFVVSALGPASSQSGDSNEVPVFNLIPTAGEVSVLGRVTEPNGRGLSKVDVEIRSTDGSFVRRAMTNSFGYYRIDEVPAGSSYIVSVSSKRNVFAESSRVIQLDDNLDGVDFVSN